MNVVKSMEFAPGIKEADKSLTVATEELNKWLSENPGVEVINIETIYGRYGTRQAHYDGEAIGIVGLRLWFKFL